MIAKRYSRRWLIIDLLAAVPFDLLGGLGDEEEEEVAVGAGGAADDEGMMANSSALKTLRLLRLGKLLRLVRALKMLKAYEDRLMPIFRSTLMVGGVVLVWSVRTSPASSALPSSEVVRVVPESCALLCVASLPQPPAELLLLPDRDVRPAYPDGSTLQQRDGVLCLLHFHRTDSIAGAQLPTLPRSG